MTEKETLIRMIKNLEQGIVCLDFTCSECYYYNKNLQKGLICRWKVVIDMNFEFDKKIDIKKGIKDFYIKKFGYNSLVEELL